MKPQSQSQSGQEKRKGQWVSNCPFSVIGRGGTFCQR